MTRITKTKTRGRRLGTLIVSCALAIAILLGGTFAWSAISQRALNIDFARTESGGRVHDHFDRASGNKDVFAENYGNNPLVVRIRLSEFMQIDGESLVPGATLENRNSWTPINVSPLNNIRPEPNPFREFVNWDMGGFAWFMPTHNRDNTDLRTETSGDGMDYIEVSDIYLGMDTTQGSTARFRPENGTANRVVYGDSHTDTLVTRNGTTDNVTHYAQLTLIQDLDVMTVYQWIDLGRPLGNFWVIDADGWAYWMSLLPPGEATSLLLDHIHIHPPEGEWFYGIDVYGQFATRGYALAELEGRTTNGTDIIRRIIGEEDDNGLEVGDTFIDNNGIEWLILEILPTGETLITTLRVMGANEPNSTDFADTLWSDLGPFMPWDTDGPANLRLETFWPQIGSDVRDAALVPNIPTDHRTAIGSWPAATSAEMLGTGTIGEAGTGLTAPTSTSATTGRAIGGTGGTGAMFQLSLAEASRYFEDNAARIAQDLNGTDRGWWLRSPGSNTIPASRVSPAGARSAIVNAIPYTGIRPALWISGVPGNNNNGPDPTSADPTVSFYPVVSADPSSPFANLQPGDTFQDNNITWRVLHRRADGTLLMTTHHVFSPNQILAPHADILTTPWSSDDNPAHIHYNGSATTFAQFQNLSDTGNTIRSWMNQFYANHTSDLLRSHARMPHLNYEANVPQSWQLTIAGAAQSSPLGAAGTNMNGVIFPLSATEVRVFMRDNSTTSPMVANTVGRSPDQSPDVISGRQYWLRSPGSTSASPFSMVSAPGGWTVLPSNSNNVGIRPAIWVTP